MVFYVLQALFCISVFCFPYYWYFMYHKRCFVYLCYDFPIIGIVCFTSVVLYICVMTFPIIGILCITSVVFVYLCYGILWLTSVVLYICVLISLLLVFYVSQALFCICLLWFPYNWYFMSHKRCFVYLCYDFPYNCILCFTSVVLYICVMISLLLVYALQELFCHLLALFCISLLWFPYNLYFMSHKSCFVYLCSAFPINWYFMSHKRCFVYHKVVLFCVMISL